VFAAFFLLVSFFFLLLSVLCLVYNSFGGLVVFVCLSANDFTFTVLCVERQTNPIKFEVERQEASIVYRL
jgi:hypothetical protein